MIDPYKPVKALFSDCGKYRYWLHRSWERQCSDYVKTLVWVMLNPSTADETNDDPTIRRVIDFSKQFGYDDCIVLNLYAYRSTNPKALDKCMNPIGDDNDRWFREFNGCDVIAAFGVNASMVRWEHCRKLLSGSDVYHLALTKHGIPKHPLYLPKSSTMILWSAKSNSIATPAEARKEVLR